MSPFDTAAVTLAVGIAIGALSIAAVPWVRWWWRHRAQVDKREGARDLAMQVALIFAGDFDHGAQSILNRFAAASGDVANQRISPEHRRERNRKRQRVTTDHTDTTDQTDLHG